jgi:hypothetical protein
MPYPNNVVEWVLLWRWVLRGRVSDGLKNISIEVQSFNNHSNVLDFNPCGYAFVVEKDQFNFSANYLKNYTNLNGSIGA